MPEEPMTGGIEIPGTKKKVPTVVVLGVAAAGALALYLITKNSSGADTGGGNALTPSDNSSGGTSTAPDLSTLQQQLSDALQAQKEGFTNLQNEVSQLQQGISAINVPSQIPAYAPPAEVGVTYPGYAYPVENPAAPAPTVSLSPVNVPQGQVGEKPSVVATKAVAPSGQSGSKPSTSTKAPSVPSTTGTVGQKAGTGTKASTAPIGQTGSKASTATKAPAVAAPAPATKSTSTGSKAAAPAAPKTTSGAHKMS